MSKAANRKSHVWCAGCLTDHILAAGQAKARRIVIRIVKRDYRVKQGVCRACAKKRLTIDLRRRMRKSRPPAP